MGNKTKNKKMKGKGGNGRGKPDPRETQIHHVNNCKNSGNGLIYWSEGGRTGAQRSPFPMNGMSLFLREEGAWFRPELSLRPVSVRPVSVRHWRWEIEEHAKTQNTKPQTKWNNKISEKLEKSLLSAIGDFKKGFSS